MKRYEDMLQLPHPMPKKRRPMPMQDRAAQFAPFAALTGYDAAISEAGRLTDQRPLLDGASIEELDLALRRLAEQIWLQPLMRLTWFSPDEKKAGGIILETTGIVKKIDIYAGCLCLADGKTIPLGDLLALSFLQKEAD